MRFGGRLARTKLTTPKADPRVVQLVASLCLGYPDAPLLSRIPAMRAALDEQPADRAVDDLRGLLAHLEASDPGALRREYVDVFDLSKRQTLYLSYWSDGDTRRRGSVLAEFKQRYRDSGFLVDTHGELPDYLPMVLEFAARVDPESGGELLAEHQPSIELIRLSLQEKNSPYAGALTAVCATLPGPSPADRASVLAMRPAPTAIETVGLEPYDARLLPLSVSGPGSTAPGPFSGAGGRTAR